MRLEQRSRAVLNRGQNEVMRGHVYILREGYCENTPVEDRVRDCPNAARVCWPPIRMNWYPILHLPVSVPTSVVFLFPTFSTGEGGMLSL